MKDIKYNVGDLIVTQHNLVHLVVATSNGMIWTKYFNTSSGIYRKECYAISEIQKFNWKHLPVKE